MSGAAFVFPAVKGLQAGSLKSSAVRRDSICSLSITLAALGYAGRRLIQAFPDDWEPRLQALENIDWKKTNPVWEDLVFVNGRISTNRSTQRNLSAYMQDVLLGTVGKENG